MPGPCQQQAGKGPEAPLELSSSDFSSVKPVQEPKCLLFFRAQLWLCTTESSLNKMHFKNGWAEPRGGSSGREGATVHPPFAFLQPACSVLPGMCAASPFVSLQSASAEEAAALHRETGNNHLQPPEPALPFPAG